MAMASKHQKTSFQRKLRQKTNFVKKISCAELIHGIKPGRDVKVLW